MYTIGKKTAITNVLGRCFRILLIFAGIALMIAACSKDDEEPKKDLPPKENPPVDGSQGGGEDTIVTPSASLEADLLLEHLSLMDATKVIGEMPVVPNTPIPNDAKDTIYLTKGLRIGYPVPIRHNGMYDITGVRWAAERIFLLRCTRCSRRGKRFHGCFLCKYRQSAHSRLSGLSHIYPHSFDAPCKRYAHKGPYRHLRNRETQQR